MNSNPSSERATIGQWRAERVSGELSGPDRVERLEPKVMDLLLLFAANPGVVLSREQIMQSLWPGVVVGEDTLARTISKLRRALGDDARTPTHIETISKRGYRLIAPVASAAAPDRGAEPAAQPLPPARASKRGLVVGIASAIVLALALGAGLMRERHEAVTAPDAEQATALVARADDFYFQYARADNEAAIELYQRVLAQHPDHAPALAGLANALVQKALRWPATIGAGAREYTRLGDALQAGHLQTPEARQQLALALQWAQRAVEIAPELAATHKALGFALSAQGRFEPALEAYRAALERDADAWGPLINIGDLLEIQGLDQEALPYFEAAYAAMARVYPQESARIRPWHANLGVLIAERHLRHGRPALAESWYRRVLAQAPLDAAATRGLAATLRANGDGDEADALCREHASRAGTDAGCDPGP